MAEWCTLTLDLVVLGRLPALAMPALACHNGGLAGDLLAAVWARLHIRDVVRCMHES